MDFVDLKRDDGEDSLELRCPSTLQAIRKEHNGEMCDEIKCHHPRCTKGKTVDVFHYYSLQTGALVDTVEFRSLGRKFTNGTR